MQHSKLIEYLQALSSPELNRLSKFVRSPYHNDDEHIIKVIDYLIPIVKSGELEVLVDDHAWKQFFGNKQFEQQKFNRLLSDVVKIVEQFLVTETQLNNPVTSKISMLEQIGKRRLDKHFPELQRFTQSKLQQRVIRDADFYYCDFQLQQLQNSFIERQDIRTTDKNLQKVLDSLDVFYFIQKMKFYAAALHYGSFLSGSEEVVLIKEILDETAQTKYSDVVHLQAYRTVTQTFLEPTNEAHFEKLKDIVTHNAKDFVFEEKQSLLSFAINYCIRKINLGEAKYLYELLSLYKYALTERLLLNDKGQLSQWEYKNITTVALRVKEVKWTSTFIEQYKPLLPYAERQNAYTFNLARYYFAAKQYNKVLSLLQQVDYSDIFYQLDAKATLLKTYYEMGEMLPVHSLKDSFSVLLRRKKIISEQQKAHYLNLLKYTVKLQKINFRNKQTVATLYKEIQATTNIADKSWLMEKLEELV